MIISLLRRGSIIPITNNAHTLVKECTGSFAGNNSKGLIFNKVQSGNYKWVALIISLCLTNSGRPYDLRLYMLEVVKQVADDVEMSVFHAYHQISVITNMDSNGENHPSRREINL